MRRDVTAALQRAAQRLLLLQTHRRHSNRPPRANTRASSSNQTLSQPKKNLKPSYPSLQRPLTQSAADRKQQQAYEIQREVAAGWVMRRGCSCPYPGWRRRCWRICRRCRTRGRAWGGWGESAAAAAAAAAPPCIRNLPLVCCSSQLRDGFYDIIHGRHLPNCHIICVREGRDARASHGAPNANKPP